MGDKDAGVTTTIQDDLHGEKGDSEQLGSVQTSDAASDVNIFQRYLKPVVISSFGFCMQSGWEGVGLTFQFAWFNGGPAAIVYGAIIAGIGSTLVAAALGEMASM